VRRLVEEVRVNLATKTRISKGKGTGRGTRRGRCQRLRARGKSSGLEGERAEEWKKVLKNDADRRDEECGGRR